MSNSSKTTKSNPPRKLSTEKIQQKANSLKSPSLLVQTPHPMDPPSSLPVEQSTSKSRKRPQNKDGRLAECSKCGMRGTNLLMCFECKTVFDSNVKIIENPFHPSLSKVSASIMKHEPEPLGTDRDQCEDDHPPSEDENIDLQDSSYMQNYENRIRVIHATQYSRPMIFHVSSNSKGDKKIFQAQANMEDTIIEENRTMDVPHTIRIIQVTSFGMKQILKDEVYRSKLKKIIFGCPSSLDHILQMLNYTSKLKAVRFGAHAFELSDQDNKPQTIEARNVKSKELESLEMAFDRSRYDDYDVEAKEIIRVKISKILEIASTAFPKLVQCNITIPEEIESSLDSFLEKKSDIKKRGCKIHHYKNNTIHFKVDGIPKNDNESTKETFTTKEQPSCSQSEAKSSKPDEIIVINLSDDDDNDPIVVSAPEITSTSKKTKQATSGKSQSLRKNSSQSVPPQPPMDWNANDEGGEKYFIPGHVALCKCGAKSKNLYNCDSCEKTFPPNVKYVKI